jgi:hypothetical protein
MQTLDFRDADAAKLESFYEAIDFPTEEELLEALENSLRPSPWLPRSTSAAVDATSRNWAQHWKNLNGVTTENLCTQEDEHSLADWLQDPVSQRKITVEPEFFAGLLEFLTERLTLRLHEVSAAQHQLTEELAKLKR